MSEAGALEKDGGPFHCFCVTGMHRSGTSLVAGLLQRHGLWLGDESDIMPANPYNPAGYFENDRLVEVNDGILSLFGGSWSSPPDFPADWVEDPRLGSSVEVARVLGERLASRPPWGFKDPRTALTLPFWRSVWGDLTVIISLRNPLATARSLNRRDEIPLHEGMALWSAHYRSLLDQTTPETRIVVDYEGFCSDPVGSASALLARLPGLHDVDPGLAREAVRQPLRHHRAGMVDLEAQGASPAVLELYRQLRAEIIHSVPDEAVADLATPSAETVQMLSGALSGLDLAIRDVHVDLQRLAAAVSRLEAEIGFIRSADLAGIAAELEYQRNSELPSLAVTLQRIAEALPDLNGRVATLEAAAEGSGNGRLNSEEG